MFPTFFVTQPNSNVPAETRRKCNFCQRKIAPGEIYFICCECHVMFCPDCQQIQPKVLGHDWSHKMFANANYNIPVLGDLTLGNVLAITERIVSDGLSYQTFADLSDFPAQTCADFFRILYGFNTDRGKP